MSIVASYCGIGRQTQGAPDGARFGVVINVHNLVLGERETAPLKVFLLGVASRLEPIAWYLSYKCER